MYTLVNMVMLLAIPALIYSGFKQISPIIPITISSIVWFYQLTIRCTQLKMSARMVGDHKECRKIDFKNAMSSLIISSIIYWVGFGIGMLFK